MFELADILSKNGLTNLRTEEMRWAMSDLVCKIQEVLSPQYLMSVTCKNQRNLIVAALITGASGEHSLQVVTCSSVFCLSQS